MNEQKFINQRNLIDVEALTVHNSKLYNKDFVIWSEEQALLLEERRYEELDVANLVEEIKNLGNNDKHSVKSNLRIVLLHLLKWQFQPSHRSNSWISSIVEHRQRIDELLEDSPSLNSYLEEVFKDIYPKAVKGAEKQTGLNRNTFPVDCPYTLSEVLDIDFFPS